MKIIRSLAEYDAWRLSVRGDVGYVASLGYMHDGHRALMARARAENAHVVVTVYVNPTQFGAGEDFEKYPRDIDHDAALCASAGVDVLLLPPDAEIYPSGFATTVQTSLAADRFEAAVRPTHFAGVCTIVTKLFNIVRPARTYFGLKDYQQLVVVRRTAGDLNLGVDIVAVETVREPDGLAMSSRNVYLTPQERQSAPRLYAALVGVQASFEAGVRDSASAVANARAAVEAAAPVPMSVEYLTVVDPHTLDPVAELARGCVVLAAARLGSTRLIDNLVLA